MIDSFLIASLYAVYRVQLTKTRTTQATTRIKHAVKCLGKTPMMRRQSNTIRIYIEHVLLLHKKRTRTGDNVCACA